MQILSNGRVNFESSVVPNLRFIYEAARGELEAALRHDNTIVATAGTGAIKDAATLVKTSGRAAIAAAGFSRRWQNALRVTVYPERGVSVNAAAFIYHKIPYAGVFETGARIAGSPMLWLPVSNAPARLGGKRMTPRLFVQTIGPLRSVNRPGHPPLLVASIAISSSPNAKLTVASLRAGAKRQATRGPNSVRSVPIFYGLSMVDIKARFGLQAIFARAHAQLGQFYLNHSQDIK